MEHALIPFLLWHTCLVAKDLNPNLMGLWLWKTLLAEGERQCCFPFILDCKISGFRKIPSPSWLQQFPFKLLLSVVQYLHSMCLRNEHQPKLLIVFILYYREGTDQSNAYFNQNSSQSGNFHCQHSASVTLTLQKEQRKTILPISNSLEANLKPSSRASHHWIWYQVEDWDKVGLGPRVCWSVFIFLWWILKGVKLDTCS